MNVLFLQAEMLKMDFQVKHGISPPPLPYTIDFLGAKERETDKDKPNLVEPQLSISAGSATTTTTGDDVFVIDELTNFESPGEASEEEEELTPEDITKELEKFNSM